MAALTENRKTERMLTQYDMALPRHTVASGKTIFAGALVCITSGTFTPGATATGLIAAGRACKPAAAGEKGDVEQGCFQFNNSASTDLITQADVGKDCYIVDDQTVAKTDATASRSKAGRIVAVDADGVWVLITSAMA